MLRGDPVAAMMASVIEPDSVPRFTLATSRQAFSAVPAAVVYRRSIGRECFAVIVCGDDGLGDRTGFDTTVHAVGFETSILSDSGRCCRSMMNRW